MGKVPKWGVNTYHKRTKPKLGRHKKNLKHNKKK